MPDLVLARLGGDAVELALEPATSRRRRPRRAGAAGRAASPAAPSASAARPGSTASRSRITAPARTWPGAGPTNGRSSARGTIASTWPKRAFDSARPKSSGSFSRVVCCTTRGPGEGEQRARLRDDHVAEAGEAREHAGRRRVRHDRDERAAGLVELVDRADRLRQLHQRENPLLHARAARGRDADERNLPRRRPLARPRELLARPCCPSSRP